MASPGVALQLYTVREDLARDFAQEAIRPRAEALDREAAFPYDLIARMFDLGLMGLSLPPEYGGSGGDFIAFCLALEEISRADAGVAITMEVQVTLGCGMVAAYGTPEQKERFLTPCLTGGRLWAFGLTEEKVSPAADDEVGDGFAGQVAGVSCVEEHGDALGEFVELVQGLSAGGGRDEGFVVVRSGGRPPVRRPGGP